MVVLFDHGTPKGLTGAFLGTPSSRTRQGRIASVVLTGSTKWSRVRKHVDRIAAAVASAKPGSYSEIEFAFESKPRDA